MEDNKSIDGEEERKSLTNEQPLNTASTNETLAASEPIAEAEQPLTINPEPSIILDMEVHHHAHDPAAPHHKKNWKSYFWEFLMLFLAVFCGFLAEYQLEHTIEHQREKEYMKTMLEDLKSDSAMFENNVNQRKSRIQMTDSLIAFLSAPGQKGKENDIYYYGRSISPPTNIFPNDRTIQQLKNSGNLRLIRNKNISNGIMAYDQIVRQTLFEMGDEVEVRAEYRQMAVKVFDMKVFYKIIAGDSISKPKNNPKLYTKNADLINELIGRTQYFKRIHQAQIITSEKLLTQAKQLGALIKKEYNLK